MNILILMLLCFLTSSFADTVEDTLFDQNKMSPLELLKEAYFEKDILLIGTSSHANFKHYERILELLEVVGTDPQLKFIVMERSHEVSELYQLLSIFDLNTSLERFSFSSEKAKKGTLCDSAEWSYTISRFLPKIREINRKRFPLPPILVKTLENMPAEYYSAPGPDMRDGSCKADSIGLKGVPAFEVWGLSNNREKQTALNFKNDVWNQTSANEKVILISHYMHMLPGFTGCRPVRDINGEWSTNIVPLSWMMEFLNQNPEARDHMNLIINDEVDRWYNPEGGLKIVKRQSSRYQGKSFAFKTEIFKGVGHERGASMFLPSATINTGLRGQHFSERHLDEIAYGVIWNADADRTSSLGKPQDYLPEQCSP
jgi:hypothetical protein